MATTTMPLLASAHTEGEATRLADLRPGQRAYIHSVRADGLLRRRLLDLGFIPGAPVESVFESPAGDPKVYGIRGASIALRRQDASQIEISPFNPLREDPHASCVSSNGCNSCAMRPEAAARAVEKEHFVVALAGNPNTGKSTVFNALTGLRQHVGNWPGKTVTRAEGMWKHGGYRFKLIDLPGTYSLLSTSADEEVARDFLLFGAPDCTVVVVDATCLERNLNLVFQIMEITDRVVVCVNLIDEAERKGITVDAAALEARLGVPVVAAAARSGRGLAELQARVLDVASRKRTPVPLRIPFEPGLQAAVDELLPFVERAFPGIPNARWIALRLIDGGDERLRHEIEQGLLADASGQIGEASLGGISPNRPVDRGR